MAASLPTRESVLEALELLVRTPSVNPTLAPGEGHNEESIARACQQWFAQNQVRAWVDEVEPGRCNCVAEVGAGSPVLVLCGHIDTVQTTGMTIPPFEPRIDANRL